LREEFGTPSELEILLGEGGDVELGLEPRNISLCLRLIHCLLTLSLLFVFVHHLYHHIIFACIVPCIIHIAYHPYMLGLFVCASLVLNHESFI